MASNALRSRWSRGACALLFWSGALVAAVLIARHGVLGIVVGYSLWALAWAAAARADPGKWTSRPAGRLQSARSQVELRSQAAPCRLRLEGVDGPTGAWYEPR